MNTPAQNATLDGAEDSVHYLRSVADLAGRCNVVAQEAIYTDKGIKLVDKGVRVDGRLYDRLVRYKLRGSIDSHLAVENAVTVPALVQAATLQCESDTVAYLLVHTLEDGQGPERLLAPLRALHLPPPLAFKLTVMREQHPGLYEHSVRVMLVAVYLGIKSGWSDRACVPLATAALLHDVGVLHMDPVWHDPAHKITGIGRKQLMAHPVTGMMIVRSQGLYSKSVEQAVLEHHECMDGSGYPRGLRGEDISPMGQILLVAEVVAAFFEKYADDAAAQRLSLTLRLNHRKYPAALVAHLLPVLRMRALQTPVAVAVAQDSVERTIGLLSGAFADWESRRMTPLPEALGGQGVGSAYVFVQQRLQALQKTLFEAGSHPRQQAQALRDLQGDAQGLAELSLLGYEALWQLQSIVDAISTRWPQLEDRFDTGDAAVREWHDACVARLAGQ